MTSLWSSCLHTQSDRMIAEIIKQHDDCWWIQKWYDMHLHNASVSALVVVQKPDDVFRKTMLRVEQWPAARCHASWLDNTLAMPCCLEWGMAWTTHQKHICMTSPWSSYVHTQSDGKIAEMQKRYEQKRFDDLCWWSCSWSLWRRWLTNSISNRYSNNIHMISRRYPNDIQMKSRWSPEDFKEIVLYHGWYPHDTQMISMIIYRR